MAISVKPGGLAALEYSLNQTDALSVTVDWSTWLEDDQISSVAWEADSGVTVSNTQNTTTEATALLTAGTTKGRKRVQCQVTTAASQKRSVAINVSIVDLI